MKKKLLFCLISTFFIMNAQKTEIIKLNQPDFNKGKSVMQALKERKSTRDFQQKELSLQHLSEVVWAAFGINREDGKRTAPSAMNYTMIDVYVVLEKGIYLYNAPKHELQMVFDGDYRKVVGMQPFVETAPVNLLYIAELSKYDKSPYPVNEERRIVIGAMDAGHIAENVYLYCASEGLGAVTRAWVNEVELTKVMKFRPTQRL